MARNQEASRRARAGHCAPYTAASCPILDRCRSVPIYADVHLRAVEPRRAPGLRLRAQRQSDARCVRARRGKRRGRHGGSGVRFGTRGDCDGTRWLPSGSHVIASDDLYGGTWRLFERVRRESAGLDFSFVDLTDLKPSPQRSARRRACCGSKRRPTRRSSSPI